MNKHNFPFILLLIICFLMLFPVSYVCGEAGYTDGSGDGSGENRDIALTLADSSIKDGAANVPLNPIIQLDFNKNICNITALPNNKKCFHLIGENGEAVAINLIFPDDQVQHTYRREAFILPRKNLEKNSTYRISVDSTLTAKNGNYIDNAHTITFTTGEQTTDKQNSVLNDLGDYTVTYETSLSETENSVPVNKELLSHDSDDKSMKADTIIPITAAAVLLIIIIFTSLIVIRRRRK